MEQPDSHVTVLLGEAVDALNVRPDGIYVDGTFGRGGHSRLILEKLGAAGRLIALDRDPQAVAAGQEIADARLTVLHRRFSALSAVLAELGVDRVDGILLDLGVSSPQIDDAARGFSFRFDGPLDMRMDTASGQTAAEWLNGASEQQLYEVIRDYGEERFAKQIARALVAVRQDGAVDTTGRLSEIVAKAVKTREPGQNPATRTFQAIRIFLNQELEELSLVLPQCVEALAPQGRLAVISFHSLEDRRVKHYIRSLEKTDTLPTRLPVRAADLPRPRLIAVGKPIKASAEETRANPRARSAVLRVAQRTGER
jgi:16S rRNA (cytosine1402-N4)-methyltransferase